MACGRARPSVRRRRHWRSVRAVLGVCKAVMVRMGYDALVEFIDNLKNTIGSSMAFLHSYFRRQTNHMMTYEMVQLGEVADRVVAAKGLQEPSEQYAGVSSAVRRVRPFVAAKDVHVLHSELGVRVESLSHWHCARLDLFQHVARELVMDFLCGTRWKGKVGVVATDLRPFVALGCAVLHRDFMTLPEVHESELAACSVRKAGVSALVRLPTSIDLLVPGAGVEVSRFIAEKFRVRRDFYLCLPLLKYSEAKAPLGLSTEVRAGLRWFVSKGGSFSIDAALYDEVVSLGGRENAFVSQRVCGTDNAALFRVSFSRFSRPEATVVKFSREGQTVWVDPAGVSRLLASAVRMVDNGVDSLSEKVLAAVVATYPGMCSFSCVTLAGFVTARAFQVVSEAVAVVATAYNPGWRDILRRYFLVGLHFGGKLWALANEVRSLVNGVGAVHYVTQKVRAVLWDHLKRQVLQLVDVDIDKYIDMDGSFVPSVSEVRAQYEVYLEVTGFRLADLRMNNATQALLAQYEARAGVSMHLHQTQEKWVYAAGGALTSRPADFKARKQSAVALLTYANSLVDPDYQISSPLHHLMLRNDMDIDLDLETIRMRMRVKPVFFAYKPRKVHRSKAGGGEMVRRLDVDTWVDAIRSRNLGVVHQGPMIDYAGWVISNWNFYGDTVFVQGWRDKVRKFRERPIDFDARSLELMTRSFTPGKYEKYKRTRLETLLTSDTSQMLVVLKPRVKDAIVHRKLAVPQTVFFNDPKDAFPWLVLLKEHYRREKELMDPRFITSDGLSPEEVAARITAFTTPEMWGKVRAIMADQSQFDKSETDTVREIEKQSFGATGMPPEYIEKWFSMNYRVRARVLGMAVVLDLSESRRSGQPTTLGGNTDATLFTEVVTKRVTKGHVRVCWTQGDDIFWLPVHERGLEKNASFIKAYVANLIEKTERFWYGWYNCSRFILPRGEKYEVVYDPYKFLAKFSRPLTTGEYKNLRERYDSYKELAQWYGDYEIKMNLCKAVSEMYGFHAGVTQVVLHAIRAAMVDYATFASVWEDVAVWR